MKSIKALEKLFKDKNNLTHALTHRSWVNEHKNTRTSNERLEFLGDAILEFVVSDKLFKTFPNKEEGYLTALRANMVNTVNLARVAGKLEVGSSIFLSKGEEESGGRENPSLLANTVEAIIGALYIDSGLGSSKKFIDKYLLNDLDEIASRPLKDAKSRLQELVQAKGYPAPNYNVIKELGPDHDKKFTTVVLVDQKIAGTGTGKNKSEAAQAAARQALNNNLNLRI